VAAIEGRLVCFEDDFTAGMLFLDGWTCIWHSAELLSYLYKLYMVCATNNYTCPYIHALSSCLPHVLLKATILHPYTLLLSFRFFYHVLDLWCHIMWHVMQLQYHMPLHCPKKIKKKKKTKINYKIREIKIKEKKNYQCSKCSITHGHS